MKIGLKDSGCMDRHRAQFLHNFIGNLFSTWAQMSITYYSVTIGN